jgi:hypothetical protein
MSTEIAKKEVTNLDMKKPTDSSFGIKGLSGFEQEDLMLPTMRIVQANSNDVTLKDGKEATPGTFYHSSRKENFNSLNVIILSARKYYKFDEEKQQNYKRASVLMVPTDSLEKPFVMYFTKMSYWSVWRPFFNLLLANGIENVWDKVINITTKKVENDKGKWFEAVMTITGDSTKEQRALAEEISERFSVKEEDTEIDFNDLNVDEADVEVKA